MLVPVNIWTGLPKTIVTKGQPGTYELFNLYVVLRLSTCVYRLIKDIHSVNTHV